MHRWYTHINNTFFMPNNLVKVQFSGTELFRKKGHCFKKNCTYLVSWCHHEQVGDTIVEDGLDMNVTLMFLPIWFCPTAAIASTSQPVQNLSAALPARGCHVLQRVIGWELSCTCIVTSWSQHRRPKYGGLADRWGSDCHAYGRKFAIKLQCQWDEKYINLKMKT